MLNNKILSVIIGAVLLIGLFIFWSGKSEPTPVTSMNEEIASSSPSPCPNFSEGSLIVNETTFSVGFAATAEAKAQGLSGCPEVPELTGLLFPFEPPKATVFWMKNMLIPIDIIWIADGQIIGIERQVPVPENPSDEDSLIHYPAPGAVDYVFEVAAGESERHDFKVGDTVVIQTN